MEDFTTIPFYTRTIETKIIHVYSLIEALIAKAEVGGASIKNIMHKSKLGVLLLDC